MRLAARLQAAYSSPSSCCMKGFAISSMPAVGATSVTAVPRHTWQRAGAGGAFAS